MILQLGYYYHFALPEVTIALLEVQVSYFKCPSMRINRGLVSFVIAYRPNTFSADEMRIGKVLEEEWEKEATEAHKTEIEIAKKKGRFFHGLPWIRVIVDAGWQKQSHGHNYTSSSGKKWAILFGVFIILIWLLFTYTVGVADAVFETKNLVFEFD